MTTFWARPLGSKAWNDFADSDSANWIAIVGITAIMWLSDGGTWGSFAVPLVLVLGQLIRMRRRATARPIPAQTQPPA